MCLLCCNANTPCPNTDNHIKFSQLKTPGSELLKKASGGNNKGLSLKPVETSKFRYQNVEDPLNHIHKDSVVMSPERQPGHVSRETV